MTTNAPATNWAGNLTFTGRHWHRPTSVDGLRRLVAGAQRIHAVGAGHSFSAVADGPGDLVSLSDLPPLLALDPAAGTVTVSGGVRYGELAPFLHRRGYALANLASLPHLTVAGAVATGTHGSGRTNPGLGSAVTAVDLVTATGDLVHLDRAHPDFPGAVVSLGALGIVAALTLAVEPDYEVAQWVYDDLPAAALTGSVDEFGAVLGAGYSVSVFTDWAGPDFRNVWLKRRASGRGFAEPPPERWLGAVLADSPRHPVFGMSPEACTEQGGVPGPWYQRLPHFRLEFTPSAGKELQTEYLMPLEHGPAALRALAAIAPELAPLTQTCEVRTVAADALWLSMAYQRDSMAVHFTWQPDQPAVLDLLVEVERALAPYTPRPHWAKLFRAGVADLAPLYPRWADFASLRRRYDPTGKFGNPFTDALFPTA